MVLFVVVAALAVAGLAVAALGVVGLAVADARVRRGFGASVASAVSVALDASTLGAFEVFPAAEISSIRTRVMCWRCPVVRRYLTFCLNLKITSFGPRASPSPPIRAGDYGAG